MFTGIIKDVGTIKNISQNMISVSTKLNDIKPSDSISVNGICLTVIKTSKNEFQSNISKETLQRTNLRYLRINDKVNLEPSLRLSDRLGGHIVTGHIDTTAKIIGIKSIQLGYLFKFQIPQQMMKYLIQKGSIAIDGISLTIIEPKNNSFSVSIIPYTYENTNFKFKRVGDIVNVEFDIFAKYLVK